MLAEYVLVLFIKSTQSFEYVGNFTDCAYASQHMREEYPKDQESVCLHEDYIYLPKDLSKIYYYPKTKD